MNSQTSSPPSNSGMSSELPPNPACSAGTSLGASSAWDRRDQQDSPHRGRSCWTRRRAWLPFHLTELQRSDLGAGGGSTEDPTCGDIPVQSIFTVEHRQSEYNTRGSQTWRSTGPRWQTGIPARAQQEPSATAPISAFLLPGLSRAWWLPPAAVVPGGKLTRGAAFGLSLPVTTGGWRPAPVPWGAPCAVRPGAGWEADGEGRSPKMCGFTHPLFFSAWRLGIKKQKTT